MALPYVCPKIKAKVAAGFQRWLVVVNGVTIASFKRFSPARTFAKRWNSMFRWLGQSSEVFSADFTNQIAATLTRASSGDGSYRPPLNVS